MKLGKINDNIYDRSVKKLLNKPTKRLAVPPTYGLDAGVCDNKVCACATATGISELEIALNTAVNNLAVSGVSCKCITTSILLSEKHREIKLKEIEKIISAFSTQYDIDVVAGDITITNAVNSPIISITAIGNDSIYRSLLSGLKPQMDIVMIGHAAGARAGLLAKENRAELSEKCAAFLLDAAEDFLNELSAVDVINKLQSGINNIDNNNKDDNNKDNNANSIKANIYSMHDVSRGGVFTALWEMAEANKVGLDIELKKIPIRQETIEICEFYGLNPYEELSTGAILVATDDGESLCELVQNAGVLASVIGKATDSNDRVILTEEERRFL